MKSTDRARRRCLVLDPLEKIDDSDVERLRKQVQTRQGQVHFAPFEGSHLRTMKTTLIGEHVLTPAPLLS
ncbi:MAG TPA: hypothetical protein VK752_10030 [Bryobacteraceae bacterium]|jgi:hypothetical protein|nr:hypothetical protein [Bryobacteraceae bacterium]